jgi:hypothetical protein
MGGHTRDSLSVRAAAEALLIDCLRDQFTDFRASAAARVAIAVLLRLNMRLAAATRPSEGVAEGGVGRGAVMDSKASSKMTFAGVRRALCRTPTHSSVI